MIIPTPLPDEFCKGILGRVRILNGLHSSKEVLNHLSRAYCAEDGKPVPAIALLARAVQIVLPEFIRSHSLLPLIRAVVLENHPTRHGASNQSEILRLRGFKTFSKCAYLCLDCVREDESFWGFSYWRRSHQIESVPWCQKHGSLLHRIYRADAYDHLPGSLLNESVQVGYSKTILENAVLKRYAQIMNDLLDQDRPIACKNIIALFNKKTRGLGFRLAQTGKRKVLSDLAMELVPADWLIVNFPKMEGKSKGEYISTVDGINVSLTPFSIAAYALGAALLWESADEAMHEISILPGTDVVPRQKLRFGQAFWNSEALLQIYVKHEGNVLNIAKELQANKRHVGMELMNAGLIGLGSISWRKLNLAYEEYVSGKSIKLLSENYGIRLRRLEYYFGKISDRMLDALDAMEIRRAQSQIQRRKTTVKEASPKEKATLV